MQNKMNRNRNRNQHGKPSVPTTTTDRLKAILKAKPQKPVVVDPNIPDIRPNQS